MPGERSQTQRKVHIIQVYIKFLEKAKQQQQKANSWLVGV